MNIQKENIKILELGKKSGLILLIGSLIFYFLIKLPLNTSVTCGDSNEGFYFIFGQHFLNGRHLYVDIFTARGPLFILFYALIVKIFGFTTWSIIAVHFIHTLMVILIGIVLYLLIKKLFNNYFFSGLVVLCWIVLQLTPTGAWGPRFELESVFALEGEYFCVLLSILSIYCLLIASQKNSPLKKSLVLSLISGLLATSSIMFKASGAVITIAIFCWVVYLFVFERKIFYNQKYNLLSFFTTLIFSLALSLTALYIHNGELSSFFDEFYQIGQYSVKPWQSPQRLVTSISEFMFRGGNSLSNFFLYLLAFLSFGWGLVRNYVLKVDSNSNESFWVLLSLWAMGSVAAVISPGDYGSYYYILVWPSVAIFLCLVLRDIITYTKIGESKALRITVIGFLILILFDRAVQVFPHYSSMIREQINLNIANQPESFQDPVEHVYNECTNERRPSFLRVADLLNRYLPNKNETIYVINFAAGHQVFSPNIYIYSKRIPPTTIYSDWLHYEQFLNKSLKVLGRHLSQYPPKVIILPEIINVKAAQRQVLTPVLQVLGTFITQNYHLKDTFNFKYAAQYENEAYLVYERNL